MNRKSYLLWTLLLVFTILLSACGGDEATEQAAEVEQPPAAEQPAEDTSAESQEEATSQEEPAEAADTPVVETEAEAAPEEGIISGDIILDPAVIARKDADSLLVAGYLFSGLVRLVDGEPVLALAEELERSDDGLEYVVTLRANCRFQNGERITSDVVIANFERWFDGDSPLHGSHDRYEAWDYHFYGFKGDVDSNGKPLSVYDGAEKEDNRTFVIHLNQPIPELELLYNLAEPQFSIVRPGDLETHGDSYGTSLDTVNGSGPYTISSWTSDELVLEPNEFYCGEVPEEALELIIQ